MKVRFRTVLFFLILTGAFGFGVVLLIAADETPAPGLILMGICGVAFGLYFRRTKNGTGKIAADDGVFEMLDRNREAHEQELDRRRREEPGKW